MIEPLKITGNWLTHESVRINLSMLSAYWVTAQMLTLVSNGTHRDICFPDMPHADSPQTPYGETARKAAAQLDDYFLNYCHSHA